MNNQKLEERAKSRRGSLYKWASTKWILLIWTLFGTSLTLSDGILTPAVSLSSGFLDPRQVLMNHMTSQVSVVSAVEGIAVAKASILSDVVPISIAILVVLFGMQSLGTAGALISERS
jgi:KUP system potassium uptake protein